MNKRYIFTISKDDVPNYIENLTEEEANEIFKKWKSKDPNFKIRKITKYLYEGRIFENEFERKIEIEFY